MAHSAGLFEIKIYSVSIQLLIDKTRQDKTRQDKTRQDKTRQDKTRQDKTRFISIQKDRINTIKYTMLYKINHI